MNTTSPLGKYLTNDNFYNAQGVEAASGTESMSKNYFTG